MANRNILLVEDDFLNRRLTKKIILANSFQVFEAKNAEEALQILKIENIDLAILDINLGDGNLDGISLATQIQNKHSIPFIFLTAYESQEIVNQAMITNPYSYLTKPFKNIDLIASIDIALRQTATQAKKKPFLLVKEDDFNIELPIEEICFIESDGNYLKIHTENKVYKCRCTVKQVIEKLPQSNFAQIHRAFIINKSKVSKFSSNKVMINHIEIPISTNYPHPFDS